jgi:peroxiredoxin
MPRKTSKISTASFEGYNDGSVYSVNNGLKLIVDLQKPTAIMLYPKNWTPICTQEIFEAAEDYESIKKSGVELYAGSTDSPEAHDVFFGDKSVPFPILTIAPRHKQLYDFVNKDGYCKRVTLFFLDGEIVTKYEVGKDDKRDREAQMDMLNMLGGLNHGKQVKRD